MSARFSLTVVGSFAFGALIGAALWRAGVAFRGSSGAPAPGAVAAAGAAAPPPSAARRASAVLAEARAAEEEVAVLLRLDEPAPAPWDRLEFLCACAAGVNGLAALLDEVLCDAFEGPSPGARLSRALLALFSSCEARAENEAHMRVVALRRAVLSAGGAGGGGGAAPPAPPAPAAFAAYLRELLAGALADRALWAGLAEEAVDEWLAGLRGGGGAPAEAVLVSPEGAATLRAARGRLVEAANLHMRLALWPLAVDANIQWRADGVGGEPLEYAEDAHQLFSMDGRVLASGARVLPAGPRLSGRAPAEPSGIGAASPEQLFELRGRKCRQLVVAAGGP
jgi:hypothetical protein